MPTWTYVAVMMNVSRRVESSGHNPGKCTGKFVDAASLLGYSAIYTNLEINSIEGNGACF